MKYSTGTWVAAEALHRANPARLAFTIISLIPSEMWKHHCTTNCPNQQANNVAGRNADMHNVHFQDDEDDSHKTASLAILHPPTLRHIS